MSHHWMLWLSLGSRWHSDPITPPSWPASPRFGLAWSAHSGHRVLFLVSCNDQKLSSDKVGPHPHCPLWLACQEAVISLSCLIWTVGTGGSLPSSAEMPQLQRGTGHAFCERISQVFCSGSHQSPCLSSFYN